LPLSGEGLVKAFTGEVGPARQMCGDATPLWNWIIEARSAPKTTSTDGDLL